jgi:hypothetical protein
MVQIIEETTGKNVPGIGMQSGSFCMIVVKSNLINFSFYEK